ncbi:putative NADPH-dependent methylglyoxal reductase GRP2 [Spathaspora sp. JA1]|nr:putative NADPH-dependent methylglyoxal reductase GRP2 [Spathaspora sp. JA1]
MTNTTVFITDANGFIAQHIVKQSLDKGYYVVGSVNSGTIGEELKALTRSNKFSYEVIPVPEKEGAFDGPLKRHPEVSVFLHTTSYVDLDSKNAEENLLKPKIGSTLHMLHSIKNYAPAVRKVIITSSAVASIGWYLRNCDKSIVYTEEDLNPITNEERSEHANWSYQASKKFAELTARRFVEQENPQFDVSFVNPVYVFGPRAYVNCKSAVLAEVNNSISKLNKGDYYAKHSSIFVDVRDVARAHLVAFEKDSVVGKKLLMDFLD